MVEDESGARGRMSSSSHLPRSSPSPSREKLWLKASTIGPANELGRTERASVSVVVGGGGNNFLSAAAGGSQITRVAGVAVLIFLSSHIMKTSHHQGDALFIVRKAREMRRKRNKPSRGKRKTGFPRVTVRATTPRGNVQRCATGVVTRCAPLHETRGQRKDASTGASCRDSEKQKRFPRNNIVQQDS